MDFLSADQVSGESSQVGYARLSRVMELENILWDKNSKLHDLDQIYQSIMEYGFVDKPLWDSNLNGGRGALAYGNGRIEALVLGLLKAQKDGLPAPRGIVEAIDDGEWCIPIEFGMDQESEIKAIRFAIDHNNITLGGARGMDSLDVANIWEEEGYISTLQMLYKEESLPVSVDEDEYAYIMANLIASEDAIEEKEDDSAGIDSADFVCRVELGDVWALGQHRLLCGSSTDGALVVAFMDMIDFPQADVICTDPPYGVAYSGTKSGGFAGTDVRIENDSMEEDDLLKFLNDAFDVMVLAGKAGTPIYCFTPQGELSFTFYRAMAHADIKIKQQLIWKKNHFPLSRSDYHYMHEPIYYGVLPGKKEGGSSWQGGRDKTSVFEYDKPAANKLHPTMKPIGLIQEILENSSQKGDVGFDPFSGSGTTILAGQILGLKIMACELSPKYATVTLDRWEEQTGMTAKKLGSLADMCEIEENIQSDEDSFE